MPSKASRSTRRPTVSTRTMALLFEGMRAQGVDVGAVCARLGVDAHTIANGSDARVPGNLMHQAWEEAVTVSGDVILGLRIATGLRSEMFDAIGYCVKHSATLGGVLDRTARYTRVIDDRYAWAVEIGEATVTISLPHAPGPPFHPQYAECILAGIGLMARRITGVHLVPTEVRLTHPEPSHAKLVSRLFEGPVRWSADVCALIVDKKYLEIPIPEHDAMLCAILEREAARMVEDLPRHDSFVTQVQSTIGSAIATGSVSAQEVAERLAVSEATLRRRLRDAQVSYQNLLDGVRYRLAQRYLKQTHMDVAEVAFSLGFADQSSFGRAFKKWSGQTALEFRRTRA